MCPFHSEVCLFNVDGMVVLRSKNPDFKTGWNMKRMYRTFIAGAEIGEGRDQPVRK